jgi:hypothetical protein
MQRQVSRKWPRGTGLGEHNQYGSPLTHAIHQPPCDTVRASRGWSHHHHINSVKQVGRRFSPRTPWPRDEENPAQIYSQFRHGNHAGVIDPDDTHPVALGTDLAEQAEGHAESTQTRLSVNCHGGAATQPAARYQRSPGIAERDTA